MTGVYGDTAQNLKLTAGVAEYDGQTITGTWKVTDTDTSTLEVGTTKTCEVTFTDGVFAFSSLHFKGGSSVAGRKIEI